MNNYKSFIRKEIYRLKKTITDFELFSGEGFRTYLESVLNTASGHPTPLVSLNFSCDDPTVTAYTDGSKVILNPFCDIVSSQPDRFSKYLCILGLLVHEAGHSATCSSISYAK